MAKADLLTPEIFCQEHLTDFQIEERASDPVSSLTGWVIGENGE